MAKYQFIVQFLQCLNQVKPKSRNKTDSLYNFDRKNAAVKGAMIQSKHKRSGGQVTLKK